MGFLEAQEETDSSSEHGTSQRVLRSKEVWFLAHSHFVGTICKLPPS